MTDDKLKTKRKLNYPIECSSCGFRPNEIKDHDEKTPGLRVFPGSCPECGAYTRPVFEERN